MTLTFFPLTGDNFLASSLFYNFLHKANLLPIRQELLIVGIKRALLAKLLVLVLAREELVLGGCDSLPDEATQDLSPVKLFFAGFLSLSLLSGADFRLIERVSNPVEGVNTFGFTPEILIESWHDGFERVNIWSVASVL